LAKYFLNDFFPTNDLINNIELYGAFVTYQEAFKEIKKFFLDLVV